VLHRSGCIGSAFTFSGGKDQLDPLVLAGWTMAWGPESNLDTDFHLLQLAMAIEGFAGKVQATPLTMAGSDIKRFGKSVRFLVRYERWWLVLCWAFFLTGNQK